MEIEAYADRVGDGTGLAAELESALPPGSSRITTVSAGPTTDASAAASADPSPARAA